MNSKYIHKLRNLLIRKFSVTFVKFENWDKNWIFSRFRKFAKNATRKLFKFLNFTKRNKVSVDACACKRVEGCDGGGRFSALLPRAGGILNAASDQQDYETQNSHGGHVAGQCAGAEALLGL